MELKKCSKCKKMIPAEQYDVGKNGEKLKTCNPCRDRKKIYNSRQERIPRPPKWGVKAYWELHPEIKTRTCTRCGKIRPETEEYFYPLKRTAGLQVICKQCSDMRKRRKEKQLQNPEYRERQNERNRQRRKEHPKSEEQLKKERERYKQYYQENHEAILERKRELFEQNKDAIKATRKAYMQTEKGRELKARNRKNWKQSRRAREKGLESSFTIKQWEECKSFFNGYCAYCGKENELTMDHFIAVANGGEYSRDNIIPACHACNSDKRDKDFWEWYSAQPFYSKLREKKILKYLSYKAEGVQQRTLFG